MNLTSCGRLTPVPVTGVWWRAVRRRHFATALAPSRFNAGTLGRPGFGTLYLTDNPDTCLLEVGALFRPPDGSSVANPDAGAWAVFPVRVRLTRAVDLCDPAQLALLGTSTQEPTGDWRGYAARALAGLAPPAPTRALGVALFRRGVDGLLTYSARDPVRRNLVVSPTRMRSVSRVELTDPATGATAALGPGGVPQP